MPLLSVTMGTRAEPVEGPAVVGNEADYWRVFIGGKKHFFESAEAYVKWAGRTLALPLAPNLQNKIPDNYVDLLSSESEDEFSDWGDEQEACNWGDEDVE